MKVDMVALNHTRFSCGRTRFGQLRCGLPWLVRGFLSLFLLVVLPSSIHTRSFLNPYALAHQSIRSRFSIHTLSFLNPYAFAHQSIDAHFLIRTLLLLYTYVLNPFYVLPRFFIRSFIIFCTYLLYKSLKGFI